MIRRRYQEGGIANAAPAAQSVAGLWDYGSSSSPSSSFSPSAVGTGMSGMWDYGSVSDLSGSMGGYGTPSAPSSVQTMERPEYSRTWDWTKPVYHHLVRGSSQSQRGSQAPLLAKPGYWTSYESPYASGVQGGRPEYGDVIMTGGGPVGDERRGSVSDGARRSAQIAALLNPRFSDGTDSVSGLQVGQSLFKEGGTVRRRYQGGGIASLLEGGMPPGMAIPGAAPGIPGGGITNTPQGEFSPVGASDPTTQGQLSADESYLMRVFEDARDALLGDHPNPQRALDEFVEVFGREALERLKLAVSNAEGGSEEVRVTDETGLPGRGARMPGLGDGLSDSIPGNIDGVEEVALSEGEYVVPADAVSGLGNGSTDAGARRMRDMVEEIRSSRGAPGQPGEVDIESIRERFGGAGPRGPRQYSI